MSEMLYRVKKTFGFLIAVLLLLPAMTSAMAAGTYEEAYAKALNEADDATKALVNLIDLSEFEEHFGLTISENEAMLIRIALMAYSNDALQIHPDGSAGKKSNSADSLTEETYVGNRNSMKFHYTWCSSVSDIKEKNKVILYSREEAIDKNYVPCKKCNP